MHLFKLEKVQTMSQTGDRKCWFYSHIYILTILQARLGFSKNATPSVFYSHAAVNVFGFSFLLKSQTIESRNHISKA